MKRIQQETVLPTHVGIIMDGNGRWAKKRNLPRNVGHKQGADVFGKIVRYAAKRGIAYLTVYAFSTENWKRPPQEIAGIMNLLRSYLKDMDQYKKENIRICVLGDREMLDQDIQMQMADIERHSRYNTGMVLNIAFNYGGRGEILQAAKTMAKRYLTGEIASLDVISEANFDQFLFTAGQPDVDLIIRTSGEQRTSNFLIWQSAYAEYVFTDVLWPDFRAADFDHALQEYAMRSRRIGGT